MSEFTALFFDEDGAATSGPDGVTFTPRWYSMEAIGGPREAEIEAVGSSEALDSLLGWLGYRVVIVNRVFEPMWWGMLDEITKGRGGLTAGVSLRNMSNRISIAYVDENNDRYTTTWAENAESILRYGYKELKQSGGKTTHVKAHAHRDALLKRFSEPMPILRVGGNNDLGVNMRAVGLWSTLGWRYFKNPQGRLSNEEGSGDQALGQGVVGATNIGFTRDYRIQDLGGRLHNLLAKHTIQVSGTGGGNDTAALIEQATDVELKTYASNTIRFEINDDILDTNGDLGLLGASDFFTVAGSSITGNNGIKRVGQAGGEQTTVKPKTIAASAAGPTITITRGNSVKTNVEFAEIFPGAATVTLTVHGSVVAHSFTPTVAGDWTIAQVDLRIHKEGNPTDSVEVSICADSGGLPGAVLKTATVAASAVFEKTEWISFAFDNLQSVTFGTTYWLKIARVGANNLTDFYILEIDEENRGGAGALRLWTGATWVARSEEADLVYRVLGSVATTTQLQNLVQTTGQFFSGTDIVNVSGVSSNQYRDGDTKALVEADGLLESGTANGLRLLATATIADKLRLYEEASISAPPEVLLQDDGTLTDASGRTVMHGLLPAGQWVGLANATVGSALARVTPFFCERAQMDCTTGKARIEPAGQPDPWRLGEMEQG